MSGRGSGDITASPKNYHQSNCDHHDANGKDHSDDRKRRQENRNGIDASQQQSQRQQELSQAPLPHVCQTAKQAYDHHHGSNNRDRDCQHGEHYQQICECSTGQAFNKPYGDKSQETPNQQPRTCLQHFFVFAIHASPSWSLEDVRAALRPAMDFEYPPEEGQQDQDE